MLKPLFLLSMLAVSQPTEAHSMSPSYYGGKKQPTKGITQNGIITVPITIGTKKGGHFVITVDNQKAFRLNLSPHSKTKVDVDVYMNEQNVVERHQICSIRVGRSYNTRMCTKVVGYWLADKARDL